jgi:hypothetical protein
MSKEEAKGKSNTVGLTRRSPPVPLMHSNGGPLPARST